ncbi:MAG: aminoacyl--tRNA ligase-related protein [Patescibacteria group bacterium]
MKQSRFFAKTLKEWPKDEESSSARFLLRAGFIDKNSSGVYTFLPLGLRVLEKTNKVIREEMNALGATEILMPALISKKYWQATDRWDVDVLYKVKDSSGQDYGLAFTHEEVLTPLVKKFISSWRDLPLALYQIQTKFRDEPRARAGLLRTKEFVMKDLYSFHADFDDLENYYWRVADAYKKIFKRFGLTTKMVEASGGDFTDEYTHEFQVLTPSGEDEVFYCTSCDFAQNKEITKAKEGGKCPKCGKNKIKKENGIEVGNIFKLGMRFSETADLSYKDKSGRKNIVVTGSYGIGSSRIVGALAEVSHDDKGLIWPAESSPFKVHLIELEGGREQALKIYETLQDAGIEVLYDDREEVSAGEKLTDADLIGITWRAVASSRTASQNKIELKARGDDKSIMVSLKEILNHVK